MVPFRRLLRGCPAQPAGLPARTIRGRTALPPLPAAVDTATVEPGATRTQLLAVAAGLELARQGRDLLARKRDALLREFRTSADVVLADSEALERAAAEAATRLRVTQAVEGPQPVQSAALAATGEVAVDVERVSVMGVEVPQIDRKPVGRSPDRRGFGLATTSARVDAVAEAFEVELDRLLDVAAAELRVRRLATEIRTTTRRVNALDHVVIVRLRHRHRAIRLALEEREREDHFRLHRAKQLQARRRARIPEQGPRR